MTDSRHYDQNELCGTKCCIAGHVVKLKRPALWEQALKEARREGDGFPTRPTFREMWRTAKSSLRITQQQAESLCGYSRHWPHEFRIRYDMATTGRERAKVGHDRIMAFIKDKD